MVIACSEIGHANCSWMLSHRTDTLTSFQSGPHLCSLELCSLENLFCGQIQITENLPHSWHHNTPCADAMIHLKSPSPPFYFLLNSSNQVSRECVHVDISENPDAATLLYIDFLSPFAVIGFFQVITCIHRVYLTSCVYYFCSLCFRFEVECDTIWKHY